MKLILLRLTIILSILSCFIQVCICFIRALLLIILSALLLGKKFALGIDQVRKLNQIFINWILIHLLSKLINIVLARIVLKYCKIYFFETTQRIYRSTISFGCFKKIFCPWIKSLIRIFPWPSSAPATSRRISQFSIWTF